MKTNHGQIVLRDGIAVAQTDDAFSWLLKHQGQSVDYATTHGGYSILTDDPDDNRIHAEVRGWIAFLTAARGYSLAEGALLVRTIQDVALLAEQAGGAYAGDYLIADEVVAPMLKACRMLLNYTAGNLELINAELDTAIGQLAARFGIEGDTL